MMFKHNLWNYLYIVPNGQQTKNGKFDNYTSHQRTLCLIIRSTRCTKYLF